MEEIPTTMEFLKKMRSGDIPEAIPRTKMMLTMENLSIRQQQMAPLPEEI